MGYARYHYSKCQLGLPDGIHIIDKSSPKRLQQVVDDMGHYSAVTQGIDTRVTSIYKLKDPKLHAKIFLLVHEGNPIGILTTTIRTFEDGILLWFDDFYIMQPYQRKGFGTTLYEFALKYRNAEPCDFFYDRPSFKLTNFLKKRGINTSKPNDVESLKRAGQAAYAWMNNQKANE
ncbi:MAG: GNAT family N-acetyltransferase [Candidatus Aenigmarchaeota archaeon]|nr:GNAT family N-acetyltransferase [Candidatus Aenigmarchaeota archaeon]